MTLLHRQMPPSRPPPNVPSTFIPRDTCTCNYKMLRHHKIHCHDINLEKSSVFVCLFIGFGNFQRMLKQCRTIVNFVSIPLYCTAILITTLFFLYFMAFWLYRIWVPIRYTQFCSYIQTFYRFSPYQLVFSSRSFVLLFYLHVFPWEIWAGRRKRCANPSIIITIC